MRRVLVAVVAASLLLAGCGTQRSTEAFCRVLEEQKQQYLETYDADQLDGMSEGDQLFGGIGLTLGAMGEIPLIYRKLADVAPEEIRADTEAVAEGFEKMLGSGGQAVSDPLSFAFGGLLQSFQMSGPLTRVEQFAIDNCDSGEVRAATATVDAPSLAEDSQTTDVGPMPEPTPTETEEPMPTATVPEGFQGVFPVSIEYMDDGWSYAQTIYGAPDLPSISKEIVNSPPGKAEVIVTYSDIPEDEFTGEPVSLDEGRNAPESWTNPRYRLHFGGLVTDSDLSWSEFSDYDGEFVDYEEFSIPSCLPIYLESEYEGTGVEIYTDAQPHQAGWECDPYVGEGREELGESDVDLIMTETDAVFSPDTMSVIIDVRGCEVQVFPNGEMQWWEDPTEYNTETDQCLGFYQGEARVG